MEEETPKLAFISGQLLEVRVFRCVIKHQEGRTLSPRNVKDIAGMK